MNNTSADRQGAGNRRDPRISAMLRTLEPAGDVLSWADARRLVQSAPPVTMPWYAALTTRVARPLRLVAAPLLVLLMAGIMWAMPAQSDQVGTMVLTKLPTAWDYGSPEFSEVESRARASFAGLAVPQGELFIKVGTTSGRPQLAFVLMGADEELSRDYFDGLKQNFPALASFEEEYQDIGTRRYDNLLEQVADRLTGRPGLQELSNDELRLVALKTMSEAGFDEIEITVSRTRGGTILIEMDAVMRFAVQGHTQEELEAAGFNEQLLGPDLFYELFGQLDSH